MEEYGCSSPGLELWWLMNWTDCLSKINHHLIKSYLDLHSLTVHNRFHSTSMVNSPGRQLLEASSAHAITASACKSSKSTAVLESFRHTGPKTPVLQRFILCFAKALMKCQSGWKNTEMKKCMYLLTPFTSEMHTINDVSKSMTWAGHSFGFTGAKKLKVNEVAHIKINTNHIPKARRRKGRNSRTCTETAWATASVLPNLSKWEIQRAGTPADFETLLHALAPTPVKSWRLILTFQELVYIGHWYMCTHLRKLTTTSTGMSSQIHSQLNLLPHPRTCHKPLQTSTNVPSAPHFADLIKVFSTKFIKEIVNQGRCNLSRGATSAPCPVLLASPRGQQHVLSLNWSIIHNIHILECHSNNIWHPQYLFATLPVL